MDFIAASVLWQPPPRHNNILISWKLLLTISLTFTLLISSPHKTCAEEIPESPSGVISVVQPKSAYSCTEPKSQNGKLVTSCKGYNEIPTDIPDSKTIHNLDMSEGNAIHTLTDGQLARANLVSLGILNMKNCQIRTIQKDAFTTGGNVITDLDLSKNNIEVLDPEVFGGLTHLRTLILKENPINRFQTDKVFPPVLTALTSVDLSFCELDMLPESAFDKLLRLEKLNLRKNHLKTVTWRAFRNLPYLTSLSLSENPWHCDCHIKFLIDILREKALSGTIQQTTCSTSTTKDSLNGIKWDAIPPENLTCHPHIDKLTFENFDVHGHESEIRYVDDEGGSPVQQPLHTPDDNGQVKLKQDVYFECTFSGYPQPEIKWLKDNRELVLKKDESAERPSVSGKQAGNNISSNVDLPSSQSAGEMRIKPRMEIKPNTDMIVNGLEEEEKKRSYMFSELLILRQVEKDDRGVYKCFVSNAAGFDEKAVYLNITVPILDDGLIVGGIGGGKRVAVWIWILVALLSILIIIFLSLLICLVWRRHEKRKQERFRKVVKEKFKDSNVDLGEFIDMKTTNPNSPQSNKGTIVSGGTTPLLDNKSDSTIVMSMLMEQQKQPLPDLTSGNASLLRNSQIFSPKPPPAHNGYPEDSRKEFFARQISEPYLRPGSAMSLSRPPSVTASQQRYIFANQPFHSQPVQGEFEPQYAVPHQHQQQIRTMPRSGSAMSMSALPESDLRRQLFLRQYSQPSYATAARRHPSVSSEPPQDMNYTAGAFNYSTLPRRPIRLQNWSRPGSPTDSTCSSYSTLSWRPMANPVTGVIYDGVGARTSADGGSSLSLNKIPDTVGNGHSSGFDTSSRGSSSTPSSSAGKVKNIRNHHRLGHNRTPSSLTRGHNDFFSFEPIQEVESSDVSNLNLDKTNNTYQTPPGYSTQSLARGEPRYKKKKPAPIAVFPTKRKEPSRAFEHLKGRSVSPSTLRNNSNNRSSTPVNEQEQQQSSANDKTDSIPNGKAHNMNGSVPVLDSPIDEEEGGGGKQIPNKLPTKTPPPPPPPKPKRGQTEEDDRTGENVERSSEAENIEPPPPLVVADGTVV